jgi:hypothetical protein
MTSFNGPWSTDLEALENSVQSIPEQYKLSFASTSKETLGRLCDPDVLHVWETDSDIDNLLQLTSVIAKLCSLGTRKEKGANANDGSMVIIAEEKSGRHSFARICQLVEYLTCADGKKHLEGTVAAFGRIVVVKGWNNAHRSDDSRAGKDAESTVKRINIAIERVFKMGKFPSGKKKIIWHHGPILHFLLHWINSTTSTLRSALHAITITGSLDLTDSVKPSTPGRPNTLPDLQRLESYAKKLDIPVVFLDSPSQHITYNYLATYMYYYAYYINTFLPPSLSRPHLHKAQDELVTFAFQLLGASKHKYTNSTVKLVKDHLDPSRAKKWARGCVDPRSYEKERCKAAGKESEIHRACQLADGPFSMFTTNNGLPAFARLAVGPAAAGSMEYHIAAPVSIDFKRGRIRPSNPSTFHILIPAPSQDLEKVTNRIQGLMMAVLERVRQEKGSPTLTDEEKGMWKAVVKSCAWALGECRGKMPKSVEEKVKFVREKLTRGTWGYAMGAPADSTVRAEGKDGGLSDAAKANAAAVQAYGAGGVQYGQVQPQSQYAAPVYGSQQHMGYGAPQGVMAPPNSPGMGQPLPQNMPLGGNPAVVYGQQQGGPPPGFGQQRVENAYAQAQRRGQRYAQSMGPAWS